MQATTAHIRTQQLTKTHEKIVELQFNILKFNNWVNEQVAGLKARGETTSDLLVNLFMGYDVVPDTEFKTAAAIRSTNGKRHSSSHATKVC
jgi:hypothetical protein